LETDALRNGGLLSHGLFSLKYLCGDNRKHCRFVHYFSYPLECNNPASTAAYLKHFHCSS